MENENWKNLSHIVSISNQQKAENEDKLYQLFEFIEDDNKKGIVKILKSGLNVNQEYNGKTPLMYCMELNRVPIAVYLVKYAQASPNFRQNNEEGPLWIALREQKMDFFDMFLYFKPRIIRGNNNAIALIEAVKISNVLMVQLLLGNKTVKVNEKDGYGNTALHYCLAKNPLSEDDIEICKLLLAAGADQNSMNANGEKPGVTSEDSMANSLLFEHKLRKELELENEIKAQKEAELIAQQQLQNENELEIEYEEVMELDPVTNTMKPVLRPKPKPRPLPKPTPTNRKLKKI